MGSMTKAANGIFPDSLLLTDPRHEISLDQTTRIFAPWSRPSLDNPNGPEVETWHEVARPQIHGYDLISSAFITPLRFVSVADEKVARVFDAPKGFIRTLKALGSKVGAQINEVRIRKSARSFSYCFLGFMFAIPLSPPPCRKTGLLAPTSLPWAYPTKLPEMVRITDMK